MAYSPREYFEHQLNMSEEEKIERQRFFEDLFAKHDEEKARQLSESASLS